MCPRKYTRKLMPKSRAQWTEEALAEAIKKVKAKQMSKREAERRYGIPARTLSRRIESGNTKVGRLGPDGILGYENEKRLVHLLQMLANCGFALNKTQIRKIAFEFAEKLNIPHNFSRKTECAGYDWLNSFLERNQELSIMQSEGLSLVKPSGMSKIDIEKLFAPVQSASTQNDDADKFITGEGKKDVQAAAATEAKMV